MAALKEHTIQSGQSAYAQQYKLQEIAVATPGKLVLHVYDYAIQSCIRKDIDGASNALVELIDSLNFDYQEIASGLFRLYEYLMRLVKVGEFELPLDLLKKLRYTWNQAVISRKAA